MRTFIRKDETCWRESRAERAALLVDGAAYFAALRSSLLKAERCVYLVGWDIDSRTPVRGEQTPDDGAPELLGELLAWIVERRTDLVVHVLLWDYSLLYTLEREPLPRVSLDWRTPRRVKVCLDDRLPFGASHHEKLVVIDDRVAYCGGLDLTIRRWDRPAHRSEEPDRCDPSGEPYGPYHDMQMVIDGAAARDLAELVHTRWNRAASIRVGPVETASDVWPDGVEPDFRDVPIGISRTRPAFEDESELRQVEAAYLNAIAEARRSIYIENQYLTVAKIARALVRQLREQPELEVVIVNPKAPSGWLEEQTMGVGRARFVNELAAEDIAERVAVLYPWVEGASVPEGKPGRVAIMVHAKLMIIDDRLLQVGSSNLNCRSMGVDRECDLLVEAETEQQRSTIRHKRQTLIAHHLGIAVDELVELERSQSSMVGAIDASKPSGRGLSRLELSAEPLDPPTDWLLDLADPERPLDPEQFIGDLFGATPVHPMRKHLQRLGIAVALLAAVLLIWRFTPLVEWADADRIAGLLERVDSSTWSGPIVLAAFVIGGLFGFPVTVLIAASAATLGPKDGFIWGLTGALSAAAVNYACGRLIPSAALERWVGSWINGVTKRLNRGGIVSMMIVRNVPIAPYTVVNIVAGAARIRFRDFMIGTALGILPGVAALTLLGDRLGGLLQDPSWANVGLLGLAIGVWVMVALGLQSLSNRMADAR